LVAESGVGLRLMMIDVRRLAARVRGAFVVLAAIERADASASRVYAVGRARAGVLAGVRRSMSHEKQVG
jgi:UDP-N-acetyl-D-mannosaminuronic acid transferase (WecB/TagA/CpsF family)